MSYLENTLVPVAIFFLLHKLFRHQKPSISAIIHCLVIILLVTAVSYKDNIFQGVYTPLQINTIMNAIILPLILFYALFFRENKDYDELLKKDIWRNWIDEPVHKKEG